MGWDNEGRSMRILYDSELLGWKYIRRESCYCPCSILLQLARKWRFIEREQLQI